jgi:BMFP domain-containing protein YqiC
MTRRSKPAGTGLESRRRDRHCVGGAILTPPTGRFHTMTQTSNRFFDEIGRLMNDAAGAAQGVKREVDAVMRNQAERILRDLDLVKREEFEAVKDMARLAREENEALKSRIAALEARLGVAPSAPDTGGLKTEG